MEYVSYGARKDGWSRGSIPARHSGAHAKDRDITKSVGILSLLDQRRPSKARICMSWHGITSEVALTRPDLGVRFANTS